MFIPHPERGQASDIKGLDLVLDHPLHHGDEGLQVPSRLARMKQVIGVTRVGAQKAHARRKRLDPMVDPASDEVAEPQAATHQDGDFLAQGLGGCCIGRAGAASELFIWLERCESGGKEGDGLDEDLFLHQELCTGS
jgi:hypothetical protein